MDSPSTAQPTLTSHKCIIWTEEKYISKEINIRNLWKNLDFKIVKNVILILRNRYQKGKKRLKAQKKGVATIPKWTPTSLRILL